MAHVTKKRKPKPPAGYIGKRGAQRPMEDKATARAIKALAEGEKEYIFGGEQFVLCGGKIVEWWRAIPSKIGV